MALLHHDELTLVFYCHEPVEPQEQAALEKEYGQLILIYATEKEPPALLSSNNDTIIICEHDHNKVKALNKAINRATCSHILWLEDNENLPNEHTLQRDTCHVARILEAQAENPISNFQIRLFPKPKSPFLLKGFQIPDLFSALKGSDLAVDDERLKITRCGSLFPPEAIRMEVQQRKDDGSSMEYFWRGMQANGEKKFNLACKYFKYACESDDLSPWNALAALNSLANAHLEIQDLERAKTIAEHSLSMSDKQRAPYLILYQYYNFKGEQQKKYQILLDYRTKAEEETAANWDVYLPEDQAAFLMAEISYRMGWHKEAYTCYKRFYKVKSGDVSRHVLERLFMYAIELHRRNEAVHYFKELFGDDVREEMTQGQLDMVLEALSLFTDHGYYDFACDVYRQLSSHRPQDSMIRNGWIRILMKNNNVEKAQALLL